MRELEVTALLAFRSIRAADFLRQEDEIVEGAGFEYAIGAVVAEEFRDCGVEQHEMTHHVGYSGTLRLSHKSTA